ncbi:DSBA oxidoreductase [Candidatus Roizmanbacteria bacterium]|nr:DSBA oxidoreductase [Candidatus Roizmanbacteria bacterium]
MNKNTIVISVVSVLGIFLILYGVYMLINKPEVVFFQQAKDLKADDHIKWSRAKKNVLTEYSDFQCPSCKSAHDFLNSIDASGSADLDITNKVTLVFRHLPLYQIHDKANVSAYAADAAGIQGKFWEMSDLLFKNQTSWSTSNDVLKEHFSMYAKELKLDVDKFTKDFESQEVRSRVAQDLREAELIGVDSTPTFFLNGQKVDVNSYNEFKKLLKSL